MPTPLFNDWSLRHLTVLCATYLASVVVVVRIPELRTADTAVARTVVGTPVTTTMLVAPGRSNLQRPGCTPPERVTTVRSQNPVPVAQWSHVPDCERRPGDLLIRPPAVPR